MKSNTKIVDREIRGEGDKELVDRCIMYGRVRDFLDLVRKGWDDEFCFGRIDAEEIRLTTLSNCAMEVEKSLGRRKCRVAYRREWLNGIRDEEEDPGQSVGGHHKRVGGVV